MTTFGEVCAEKNQPASGSSQLLERRNKKKQKIKKNTNCNIQRINITESYHIKDKTKTYTVTEV